MACHLNGQMDSERVKERERAKERKREGERTVISGEFVKTDGSKIFHFIIIIYG